MTTAEFIEKTYNTTATRERRCSSVFTDYRGTVYSYGYHYPLAFHVKGLDFINTVGYSNTTSKHISWAWRAVGFDAVAVKLWRDERGVISSVTATEEEKLATIMQALQRELRDLQDEADRKTRKNTWVYQDLQRRIEKVSSSIEKVTEVLW